MISLRNRLLASYLFLMVSTVGGIVIALFVTTASTPAPPDATYRRLASHVPNIDYSNALGRFLSNSTLPPNINVVPSPSITPPIQEGASGETPPITQSETIDQLPRSSIDYYSYYAEQNDLRVMELTMENTVEDIVQVQIAYDSANTLETGMRLRLRLDNWQDSSVTANQNNIVYGSFASNGNQWLFSGETFIDINSPNLTNIRLVAMIRPTVSLQQTLLEFGSSLVTPLLQALLTGSIIAFALSALISRTIARPLQAASDAATAVAEGDLSKRVPVTGPSEVRSVARAFNHMAEEVEKTQQSQRDLLANVSHDLKTPLTSIQGYSQAIIDGAVRNPSKAAEIIHDEATRLTRMVIQLTELARLQSGQLPMNMETLDIEQLTCSVAQKLNVVAEEKGVTLITRTHSVPNIMADGDRMVQVLDNLLSNAIKYTPAGGEIIVRTHYQGNGAVVEITDTGIGIAREDLDRIFERFYQVDKARGPSRGTGLGLAITYEIVMAHGGQITVDSEEGRGTTFRLWLPAVGEMETEDELVPAI